MDKLPEELTPELLELVLGIKASKVLDIVPVSENEIIIRFNVKDSKFKDSVNIDTLTRLMKEWCTSKHCALFSGWDYEVGTYNCLIARHNINEIIDNKADTEFEAVLKATHWVAKEKNLL